MTTLVRMSLSSSSHAPTVCPRRAKKNAVPNATSIGLLDRPLVDIAPRLVDPWLSGPTSSTFSQTLSPKRDNRT